MGAASAAMLLKASRLRRPTVSLRPKKNAGSNEGSGVWFKAPGDDLLLHGLSHTTIGAVAFHFRVRDGIGWFHNAMVTRETVGGSRRDHSLGVPHAHALTFGVAYKLDVASSDCVSRRVS